MHSPGLRRLMASSVPGPRASPVTEIGILSSCESRSATGRRRMLSWTLPSGRPRWLARMTMAPWARRALIVGRAATIRLSSVILPSARGTLKSTRTNTRLPAASRSRMVSLFILTSGLATAGDRPGGRSPQRKGLEGLSVVTSALGWWLEALGNELGQVGNAAAVAPFVVVPGQDLNAVSY